MEFFITFISLAQNNLEYISGPTKQVVEYVNIKIKTSI